MGSRAYKHMHTSGGAQGGGPGPGVAQGQLRRGRVLEPSTHSVNLANLLVKVEGDVLVPVPSNPGPALKAAIAADIANPRPLAGCLVHGECGEARRGNVDNWRGAAGAGRRGGVPSAVATASRPDPQAGRPAVPQAWLSSPTPPRGFSRHHHALPTHCMSQTKGCIYSTPSPPLTVRKVGYFLAIVGSHVLVRGIGPAKEVVISTAVEVPCHAAVAAAAGQGRAAREAPRGAAGVWVLMAGAAAGGGQQVAGQRRRRRRPSRRGVRPVPGLRALWPHDSTGRERAPPPHQAVSFCQRHHTRVPGTHSTPLQPMRAKSVT